MGRVLAAIGLFLVSAFMLIGFLVSDADPGTFATVMALLITVVLPAGGGALLLASRFRGGRASGRRAELRQQTIEAEILRLAIQRQGKLTVVEVMTELAIGEPAAKHGLDALMTRGLADIEVTDSGVLVYSFGDIRNLSEKADAKGLLED